MEGAADPIVAKPDGVPPQPASPPSLDGNIAEAFRIAIGLAGLVSGAVADVAAKALQRSADGSPDGYASGPASGLWLATGAAIGLAVSGARWSVRVIETLARGAGIAASIATSPKLVREPLRQARDAVDERDARWRLERSADEAVASRFLRELVPRMVEATLDQLDLNELVRARINVNAIVESVDLDVVAKRFPVDDVVSRIDVDDIVARVDLQRVIERVDMDAVASRIDIDAIAGRLDVDAIAGRLDLDTVVGRLDLTAIAREVLEELDLPEMIRETMGSMTSESVGGIRVQTMNADRAVSRLVDRVFRRDDELIEVDSPAAAERDTRPEGERHTSSTEIEG